jgi:hypothetical protein
MISPDGGWWESNAEEPGELGVVAIAESFKDWQLKRYSKGAV